jgi:hypothetical protein
MRFNHPRKWFGPAAKMGERTFAPRTWEGWAVLLGAIAAVWAVGLYQHRADWVEFERWFVGTMLGKHS